jgi:hypothetical protein
MWGAAGGQAFYNVWIPLRHVLTDPLAVLLPETADVENEAAPFKVGGNARRPLPVINGLCRHRSSSSQGVSAQDRTSLSWRKSSRHRWVYFPDLRPGQALVW